MLIKCNSYLINSLKTFIIIVLLTVGDIMSRSMPISYENVEKYTELGLNIAFYRKKKSLTQEQLAEKVGISRSHLSAIEAPNIVKPFSIELLFKIADALEIQPSLLLEFRKIK